MEAPKPGEISSLRANVVENFNAEQQRAIVSKVTWRLLPLLFFCYIIAYIDRINVGFAKLHLREALGVNEDVFNGIYGFGAGLFFIGYFLFEVPSNLILQRVGARIWIARIMIFWGIVSMGFMFLKGVTMFYVMRFLLGAAEAGFFPGVILYLTFWYPARERARAVAIFALGGILAGVIGSPISGALLHMDGIGGFAGWQWLFLIEAIPAMFMGLVVLFLLPNGPQQAKWLTPEEKAWIQSRVDAERPTFSTGHASLAEVFSNRQVWIFCLLYLLLNTGGYGYEMWLPSIVKSLSGLSDWAVGCINAIPYFAAGVAMFLVAGYSDRTGQRKGVVSIAALISAIGFGLSAYFQNPFLALTALILAFVGLKCAVAPLWAMATTSLGSTAAVTGIALINSVGNLGGFIGPYLVGVIKDKTGSPITALLFLGAALLTMSLLAVIQRGPESKTAN